MTQLLLVVLLKRVGRNLPNHIWRHGITVYLKLYLCVTVALGLFFLLCGGTSPELVIKLI